MPLSTEQISQMDKISGLSSQQVAAMDKVAGGTTPSQTSSSPTPSFLKKVTNAENVEKVPVVGPILGTLSTAVVGNLAGHMTKPIEQLSKSTQQKSLALIKMAQTETDPAKKKQLLDESRKIDRGMDEGMSKYNDLVQNGILKFNNAKNDKEVATEYAKQAGLTGLAAGDTLMAVDTVAAAKDLAVSGGKYLLRAAKTPGGAWAKIKALNPSVNLGNYASKIAEDTGIQFDNDLMNSQIESELKKTTLGQFQRKSLEVAQEIKDTPITDIAEALTKRRQLDKQISRNIFGIVKKGSPKNVVYQAARDAINTQIKAVPELAKLDKALSLWFGVKDPVMSLISNKLVQGGAALFGVSKLFGSK